MVNANVVISVSAVLALILTIVVVMRQDGDPTYNFSVTVTGSYAHADGNTYEADMYYCIGADCQFHGASGDFPGYCAMVGFEDGDSTYVTEHSTGQTWEFKGDTLVSCQDSDNLHVSQLTSRVEQLTDSWAADNTFTLDVEGGSGTFTMATYNLNGSPATDFPSVRGKSIPAIAECQALWDAANDAACPDGPGNCDDGTNSMDAEDEEDETIELDDLSLIDQEGRKLWNRGTVNA